MLRVFKALWTQDNPSFDGEFFRFKDIGFAPKPCRSPTRPSGWAATAPARSDAW